MSASTPENVTDSPAYWFAVMLGARTQGRFLLAQRALDELRRLGLQVRFVSPRPPSGRGPGHAA